jgi:hypothetical protein
MASNFGHFTSAFGFFLGLPALRGKGYNVFEYEIGRIPYNQLVLSAI